MKSTPTPCVLLCGFAPFGGESINPSWEVVRGLEAQEIAGHRIVTRQLPTEFVLAAQTLRTAIRREQPSLVLCVGQAGGRAQISIERVAINLIDARIPDNAGLQPIDLPVVRGAPAAYFSSLPIKAMLAAARAQGLPVDISNSAGTYVCNQVFYVLMHTLANGQPPRRGGFVHIPYFPEQAAKHPGAASLARDTVIAALQTMLDCALRRRRDLRLGAGATH